MSLSLYKEELVFNILGLEFSHSESIKSIYPSIYLSIYYIYNSIYPSYFRLREVELSNGESINNLQTTIQSTYLFIYPSIYLFINLSIHLFIYLSIYLSYFRLREVELRHSESINHLQTINQSTYLFIYPSISTYLFIYPSISIYLSIHISILF